MESLSEGSDGFLFLLLNFCSPKYLQFWDVKEPPKTKLTQALTPLTQLHSFLYGSDGWGDNRAFGTVFSIPLFL